MLEAEGTGEVDLVHIARRVTQQLMRSPDMALASKKSKGSTTEQMHNPVELSNDSEVSQYN